MNDISGIEPIEENQAEPNKGIGQLAFLGRHAITCV